VTEESHAVTMQVQPLAYRSSSALDVQVQRATRRYWSSSALDVQVQRATRRYRSSSALDVQVQRVTRQYRCSSALADRSSSAVTDRHGSVDGVQPSERTRTSRRTGSRRHLVCKLNRRMGVVQLGEQVVQVEVDG
jgi:hypothetical protein